MHLPAFLYQGVLCLAKLHLFSCRWVWRQAKRKSSMWSKLAFLLPRAKVQEQLGSVRKSNRDPIKHHNTIMNASFGNDCSIAGRYACQEELSSTVSMSAQYHCCSVGISLIVSLHNVAAHWCRFRCSRVRANSEDTILNSSRSLRPKAGRVGF